MATLNELAELIGGEVVGDGSVVLNRMAPIESAGPGDITFVANPKYLAKLKDTTASAVIVKAGIECPGVNLLICANPYLAFAKVLTALHAQRPAPQGVMDGAWVDPSAELGADVTVHPGCVVGKNVRVGRGTILYPGVVLYDDVQVGEDCLVHAGVLVREQCRLGNRVVVQPGAVIGSDGFGFAPDGKSYYKIPQVGIVAIEDDVEVGANVCIDRAAMGVTLIKRGTKIDNLVQIAHNVSIGEDTILVAQVGIAGSSKVGDHCTLGGQVGVSGHLKIGDNTMVGAQSGIISDLPAGQVFSGTPTMPHREWLKASASMRSLPAMRKTVSNLQKRIEELEKLIKER
ncbi:acyl-(acyl carrier protein)--UDP-3-O-(3-hydroxyacyl)-glucosamine/UDP-3-N-(3-hydroxyacyl)-glucosediamine 2-N-acyltransferase [Syntrophotalea carbinolica DSM 2380]|uniref:UDP-3-O-acylglucosamine N-acyltransferase n=1 Tax=Syntrophotalea carbinolica (strain DSM 2380 / NBRC 103641 / GraBd1) TaxID=338963 RepID=LPXD_SYNC1|nr:UDP-3-O-(3-hydroxymyristoyl)glucosamine N-acyltransferase [Syntrophotalea carbinolica]Q3A555.1 RecName: Full=UDP-3-O-acylglucosamine N-acyltransferase [Syntrophotalea carbinolica DSM 2380]ABA88502.1 acyl-(acyl carrier protein)--UDP-3-O-(3-hydroxyacyl)-glucosamine/UDP-3-N-(3-hydroxyacyl)-glucosediamine 2-N-acyltransferase [Syntrophotalea carbinolica DSM 2380]